MKENNQSGPVITGSEFACSRKCAYTAQSVVEDRENSYRSHAGVLAWLYSRGERPGIDREVDVYIARDLSFYGSVTS